MATLFENVIVIDSRAGKEHDTTQYRMKTFGELNPLWQAQFASEISCSQRFGYSVEDAIANIEKLYSSYTKIGKKLSRTHLPLALRLDNYAISLLVTVD
jgi:hypothetical protein